MQSEDGSTRSDDDGVSLLTFDFETDNLNDDHLGFSASPFYRKNEIVAEGYALATISPDGTVASSRPYGVYVPNGNPINSPDLNHVKDVFLRAEPPWLVVGHNVRFDLHYLRRYAAEEGVVSGLVGMLDALRSGDTLLWDTQFAEYLLTGQDTKMISLDNLAKKYGAGKKTEDVRDFWKEGYKTRDIDADLLTEYCVNDVAITQDIALRQIARAEERGLLDYILHQMRSLYVVSEYEYNGIHVDVFRLEMIQRLHRTASKLHRENYTESFLYLSEISNLMDDLTLTARYSEEESSALVAEHVASVSSSNQLKKILFGGVEEIKIPYQVGTWRMGKKAGEPRYKYIKREITYRPRLSMDDVPVECLTEKGLEVRQAGGILSASMVSISEDNADWLRETERVASDKDLTGLINAYVGYRFHQKIDRTYCENLKGFRFEDGRIHGNYNVDLTPTGRLTSSHPNMQNLPSDDASQLKEVFVSRWEDGRIGVVDFKQLEIVGLAFLSGDEKLIRDLSYGVDIHTKTGTLIGLDTSHGDLRRDMKRVVFGTIYGAGAKKLAQGNNFSVKQIKEIKVQLANEYPRAFQEFPVEVQRRLENSCKIHSRSKDGLVVKSGYLRQPSGRRIRFIQEKDYFRSHVMAWPFTCCKNWPVQSIAADIVSVARVVFFDTIRELSLESKVKMVNEVHDEIVFDLNCDEYEFKGLVDMVELRLPDALKNTWNLTERFTLPLKLESGVGVNWKEAK